MISLALAYGINDHIMTIGIIALDAVLHITLNAGLGLFGFWLPGTKSPAALLELTLSEGFGTLVAGLVFEFRLKPLVVTWCIVLALVLATTASTASSFT